MRILLTLLCIASFSWAALSQDARETRIKTQSYKYSYTYISIAGKAFSKSLKVDVDFGDTPEQIRASDQYSAILTNKKSYAAILNYMIENQFELVETLTQTSITQGSGGTSGIIFIMRKKEIALNE